MCLPRPYDNRSISSMPHSLSPLSTEPLNRRLYKTAIAIVCLPFAIALPAWALSIAIGLFMWIAIGYTEWHRIGGVVPYLILFFHCVFTMAKFIVPGYLFLRLFR